MLISVIDDEMFDGADGCKREREIWMRTEGFLCMMEYEGFEV